MGFSAKVVAGSVSEAGKGLYTLECTFPRFILAELRTHRIMSEDEEGEYTFTGRDDVGRDFSMNSASSRAIPSEKLIKQAMTDPFIPDAFPVNKPGMNAVEYIRSGEGNYGMLVAAWLEGRDAAVQLATRLNENGVHKQIANRPLELYLWHKVIVTSTEWDNFFRQRIHPMAQPEFNTLASLMRDTIDAYHPERVVSGKTHAPYLKVSEKWILDNSHSKKEQGVLLKASIARCARVSTLHHDGKYSLEKDLELFDKLYNANPPHWSPFEHVALPAKDPNYQSGNFTGWIQARELANSLFV